MKPSDLIKLKLKKKWVSSWGTPKEITDWDSFPQAIMDYLDEISLQDKKEEVKVNKDCLLGKCCHILGNCNFDKKEEQDFCEQGNLNCFKKTCKHLNPSPVTECKHEDGLVATETINTGDFITIEGNHARKWKKDDPISKMQVELFTN